MSDDSQQTSQPLPIRRRRRWLVVGSIIAATAVLGGGAFAFLSIRQATARRHEQERVAAVAAAKREAIRTYVNQVGPSFRSMSDSWSTYREGIGGGGEYEGAVSDAYNTALELRPLLASLDPPPEARLFHARAVEIVDSVILVVEVRNRGAQLTVGSILTGREDPSAALERSRLSDEGGRAFYLLKTAFPEANSLLDDLDSQADDAGSAG